jgi:hypothetical protein
VQNLDRGLIFQNSRDLFARFPKYPGITNYFLTDNSWTGRACSGAPKLAGGGANRRGGTGSSSRASPGLERRRGGRATMGKARWCRRSVRGRLELTEREARRGCSPFIGGRGGVGEEMPMGNGWAFTADTIDGRGGC